MEQTAGAGDTTFTFHALVSPQAVAQEFVLQVVHQLGSSSGSVTAQPVSIDAKPQARINGSVNANVSGKPGATITLRGGESQGSRDGDVLEYQWRQVSGPDVMPATVDAADLVIVLPENKADVVLELIVNNGRSASEPATAHVDVNKGGGGALTWLLALFAIVAVQRRK